MFALTNSPHAKKEVAFLKGFNLNEGTFRRHDPKMVIEDHFKSINLYLAYRDESNPQELFF